MTLTPWFRLTLDMDHDGNWRGISYEVRQEERIKAIHVLPEPGPFDNHHELLGALIEDIESRYGVQLKLW